MAVGAELTTIPTHNQQLISIFMPPDSSWTVCHSEIDHFDKSARVLRGLSAGLAAAFQTLFKLDYSQGTDTDFDRVPEDQKLLLVPERPGQALHGIVEALGGTIEGSVFKWAELQGRLPSINFSLSSTQNDQGVKTSTKISVSNTLRTHPVDIYIPEDESPLAIQQAGGGNMRDHISLGPDLRTGSHMLTIQRGFFTPDGDYKSVIIDYVQDSHSREFELVGPNSKDYRGPQTNDDESLGEMLGSLPVLLTEKQLLLNIFFPRIIGNQFEYV